MFQINECINELMTIKFYTNKLYIKSFAQIIHFIFQKQKCSNMCNLNCNFDIIKHDHSYFLPLLQEELTKRDL